MFTKTYDTIRKHLVDLLQTHNWVKQEWFIFLAINVLFPFTSSLFFVISREYYFRVISILAISALIFLDNRKRIRKNNYMKIPYIIISILNLLSLFLLSNMSFATSIKSIWQLTNTFLCCSVF